MAVQTVRQLCKVSDLVEEDGLIDQIANLEDLHRRTIDADAFFRRNHFTEGLEVLVRNGFERLSGRSDGGAYYLSQSMGGGKTHSLIAFALLAQDAGLRHRVIPDIAPSATFGSAKVVIFNGHQNPVNFLWGEIADRLGRPETMSRFWNEGAKTPGVNDWIAALGDEPVLILLDELPSYLQMAEGQMAGNTTLADITIGALERLFNALTNLPRACVVVTNLMDDVFAEGSTKLKMVINNLNKQYGKYAQAITPVQQNSGEVFQIIRKKLFDKLPDDDVVEEIAQAYVDVLNRAKKVDDVPAIPEHYIGRIKDSYPFHPSIRDVVARFKENPGYQQTRALIRILRLAVRAAVRSEDHIFLIGLQHLDFNQPAVVEEIRKINDHFTNAISKDIADRGNALSEQIDATDGASTASAVSKLLLMSSLSVAEQPIRGLRRSQIIEYLVDPLTRTPSISAALEKLTSNAEYLFQDADQRIYFGRTANVVSEINNTAASLTEEVVDQELRTKLTEVFEPRTKSLYRELAILPSLDQIKVGEDNVTLIVVEKPATALPQELIAWWEALDRQNRVLILAADANAVGRLRQLARQTRAIEIVNRAVMARQTRDVGQLNEINAIRMRVTNSFTSAVRETFTTLLFPTDSGLRTYAQFRMEFDNNDYNGEEQILKTLADRGKFYSSEKLDMNMAIVREEAEHVLFDANAVQRSELRRKAAAQKGFYWLASGGLDHLISDSVRTKHWRERDGLIEKKFERTTSVSVRLDGPLAAMVDTGIYRLIVTPEDADVVYASETGRPDPAVSGKVAGRAYETSASKVWFLASNSRKEAVDGPVREWMAPIEIRLQAHSTSTGTRIEWLVMPRAAMVQVTFDGSDPKTGQISRSGVEVPPEARMVRIIAAVDGRYGEEVHLQAGVGVGAPLEQIIRDDLPLLLLDRIEFDSITRTTDALDALQAAEGATVQGVQIEIGTEEGDVFSDVTFGERVSLTPNAISSLMTSVGEAGGFVATRASASFNRTQFSSGKDFKSFADKVGLDFDNLRWSQDDGMQE